MFFRNLNEFSEKPSSGIPISRTVTPGVAAVQSDIMSTSCTLPSGPHHFRRKHSWAQPEKEGDSRPQSPDDASDALARLVAIAKRTGLSDFPPPPFAQKSCGLIIYLLFRCKFRWH